MDLSIEYISYFLSVLQLVNTHNDITVASIAKVRQKSADESESLTALEQEMEAQDNEEGDVEDVAEDSNDDGAADDTES